MPVYDGALNMRKTAWSYKYRFYRNLRKTNPSHSVSKVCLRAFRKKAQPFFVLFASFDHLEYKRIKLKGGTDVKQVIRSHGRWLKRLNNVKKLERIFLLDV